MTHSAPTWNGTHILGPKLGYAAFATAVCFNGHPMHAQTLSCTFDSVCSPQVGCEPLDDLPFEVEALGDGVFAYDDENGQNTTTPTRREGAPLTFVFDTADGTLLMSLSQSGSVNVTRHQLSGTGRVESATFTGTCGGF